MGNSTESKEIDQYNHPRLGTIKRLQQATSSQFIGYDIILQNQKVYEEWQKQLRWIKNEQSVDQILFLPIEQSYKQTSFCGTGGIASLKYQDYLYSLLLEIINRREIKRPFNQQELLYLFYSLVKISSILEKKNRVIGDIKPQNILVNQEGYVKITSQFSWPGLPNKFARSWDRSSERFLLSPEQCEQRHKKKQAITFNPQDSCSQAFSIGMTILEAGTLRDCSEVYGKTSEYKFNQIKVREYLDIFQGRYSKEFFQMVREMLHPNPKKRWRSEQSYKILKPYEYQIMNLEQIAMKLDSSNYIPRIQRQQKISIKKIGQSHFSNSSKNQNNQNNQNRQSKIIHTLQPKLPNSQILTVPPYQSSIHFIRQSQNHPQGINMNGSTYHPEYMPNHQLIVENTNFGRQLAPQPTHHGEYRPNQHMVNSLPINGLPLQSENGPEYITQNSLYTPARPLFDTSYIVGNPRKQFY